jgi:polyisoprenoid-binding protein YceI
VRIVNQACLIAVIAMTLSAVANELDPQAHRDTAERYTIDSARTVVSFEVRSFGIFRQRARFGTTSGRVSLDPQAGTGNFDVVIDARTIQAGNEARLRIIRGTDFLNVEQFPEISYKSAHVVFYDGEPIRVDGNLTLLGVTHSVVLDVSGYHCTPPATWQPRRCMMDASANFRRSEFGMNGSMPLAGDRVRLAIHAEATADPVMKSLIGMAMRPIAGTRRLSELQTSRPLAQ